VGQKSVEERAMKAGFAGRGRPSQQSRAAPDRPVPLAALLLTAEVLPSVFKVAGVWRSLSWCLESVMLWIMGFTKFGDKCVNDLDLF